MEIRLLGGPTGEGGSPRLYATDRETDIAQGWPTDEPGRIEIPHRLLQFAEPGTCLTGLTDTGRGTFYLRGTPVADEGVLAKMAIPAHETAIEVEITREVYPDGSHLR